MNILKKYSPLFITFIMAGCATQAPLPVDNPDDRVRPTPVPISQPTKPPVKVETQPVEPKGYGALRQVDWVRVTGWPGERPAEVWTAFMRSCQVLQRKAGWQEVCNIAATMSPPSDQEVTRFFETYFIPYQAVQQNGSTTGLITGYYEPLLRGSPVPTARYRYPIYGVPDDLIQVDLGNLYPEFKNKRIRGRLVGNKLVPYYSRADIVSGRAPLKGKELVWVDDPVEVFFLHIQGSGRVQFEDGRTVRIGYADQNGHPFRSSARYLADNGELPLEKTSMQGMKAWARANPEKVDNFLNYNASYVFFKFLPSTIDGAVGAMGFSLVAERSVAVDPTQVPLGAPVFLSTRVPYATQPMQRIVMAQDTGGAIRGPVRADFFFGFGDQAGEKAGRMKQQGNLWYLLPKGLKVN